MKEVNPSPSGGVRPWSTAVFAVDERSGPEEVDSGGLESLSDGLRGGDAGLSLLLLLPERHHDDLWGTRTDTDTDTETQRESERERHAESEAETPG